MVNFKEVFGTGLENVREAGERVWKVVRSTARQLGKALDLKALLLGWSLLVTGAITWCDQQTQVVNHAPEANVTELVERVEAWELRLSIKELLSRFGVEDPDGDKLSVEVISGPARIEDGYLIVNAGEDVEVKLKVSDGKWWELELTLRFDVNHPPEVQNDTVSATASLPEWADSFTMSWQYILNQAQPRDPDGDPLEYEIINLVWATGYNLNEEWGYLEITWVSGGVDKVEFDVVVRDPNGDEVTIHVIVNISWEAVDNPTQISDLNVNIVDRAVEGEPNGVYAWGMVDVEFKVKDADWVSEVAVLVWDGLEIPVDLDPAGIARLSFDTSGLLVWIYPVKVRVVDGAWNEKVIELFDLKVHPYGEIIDPDSYEDLYWTGFFRNAELWDYLRILNTLWLREWVGLTFWGEAQLIIDGDGNDVSGAGIVVGIDPSWIVLNADGSVWIEVKRVMDRVYNEKWVDPYGTYEFRLRVTVNTDEGPVDLSFPVLVAWPFE